MNEPQKSPMVVPGNMLLCTHCGTLNSDEKGAMPGSGWIELVLYFFWLLPGIIYSIWRRSGKTSVVCRSCSRPDLVSVQTPVGSRLLRKLHPDATVVAPVKAPEKEPMASTGRVLIAVVGFFGLVLFVAFIAGVINRM